MIIDHDEPSYKHRWQLSGKNKWNGAFYYSKEIVKNIIPRIETDRNWVTINQPGKAFDHSIFFVHNNLRPEHYDWLVAYKDLILVCGIPETMEKVAHLGTPVYLPLSVDVEYVERFKRESHPKDTAIVGRPAKIRKHRMKADVLSGFPRGKLLEKMGKYKRVYAVGRTAIEARILGCEILPYDERFPDPSIWRVLDNKDAAKLLQIELDRIDLHR